MSDGEHPDDDPSPLEFVDNGDGDQALPYTSCGHPGHDELLARYEATLRRTVSLPELPMRRTTIGESLDALCVDDAVWFIDQLVRGALWGRNPEIDAMIALSDWLIRLRHDIDDYERFEALFRGAHEAGREAVLYLLRDPPAHRSLGENGRLPEARLPFDRDVTLGERRRLAAGRDRHLLDRLLLDPDPLVIERLLENPTLQTRDVLTIATRRPTIAPLILAVLRHPRWFLQQQVREAIVRNPYSPTGAALRLLPTMGVITLRKLRYSGDLHPMIQEASALYVKLREERTAPWRV